MSFLGKIVKERFEKGGVAKNIKLERFDTGFMVMDWMNAYRDKQGALHTGLEMGHVFMVAGKSGSGKTTLCIQLAAAILGSDPEGVLVHLDYEGGVSNGPRVQRLLGWSDAEMEERYAHYNAGLYSDTIYGAISEIADAKLSKEGMKALAREDGTLPPTVVLVDSLALAMPKKMDDGGSQQDNNMRAAMAAKANATVFKQVLQPMKEANITLLVVNHIQKKIETSAFAKTAADINYFKQDEVVPGGNAPQYLSNYLIRMDPGSKLKKEEEYGIKGFIVKMGFVKSRTCEAGLDLPLVFDQRRGMQEGLSLFQFLRERKDESLTSSSSGWSLEGYDKRFRLSEVAELWEGKKSFRKALKAAAKRVMADWPDSAQEVYENKDAVLVEDSEYAPSAAAPGKKNKKAA